MNIIITVAALDGFHGSVLHVKEWVEGISKYVKNSNIAVVSIFFDKNTKKIIEDAGAKVYDVQEYLSLASSSAYDLIIAFHFPILERMLFAGVRSKKIINWSLSPYEPLEAYSAFWADLTLLIANSEETKIERAKTQRIPAERIIVINNPLPDKFQRKAGSTLHNSGEALSSLRVLVVSNHVPLELSNLIQLSRNTNNFFGNNETTYQKGGGEETKGLSFVHYGQGGDVVGEVTPELIEKFDVVVTIGKTIQYCLGMSKPVFEYDRFGGRGYINLNNYEEAKKFNFSGRPKYRNLSSTDLAGELLRGYPEAKKQVAELQRKALIDFSIRSQIECLFQLLSEKQEIDPGLLDRLIKPTNFELDSVAFINSFRWLKGDNYYLCGKLNSMTSDVHQLQEIIIQKEEELRRIESSSKSYGQQLIEVIKQREEELSQIRSSRAYKVALILRRFKSFITG